MKFSLPLLLFLYFSIAANPIRLHIATWPSSAEVSIGAPHDPHLPQNLSPLIFQWNSPDTLVDLYLFKPGYISRHVQVRLKKQNQDNYAHFFLTQETDSTFLKDQQDYVNHRKRIQIGNILAWSSLIPLLSAVGFAGFAQWEYSQANALAQKTNAAQLHDDPQYAKDLEQMDKHIQEGNQLRNFALESAIAAAVLSSLSIVFKF